MGPRASLGVLEKRSIALAENRTTILLAQYPSSNMSLFSSVLCFQAHVIYVLSSKYEIMFHKQLVNKLFCVS